MAGPTEVLTPNKLSPKVRVIPIKLNHPERPRYSDRREESEGVEGRRQQDMFMVHSHERIPFAGVHRHCFDAGSWWWPLQQWRQKTRFPLVGSEVSIEYHSHVCKLVWTTDVSYGGMKLPK